MRHQASILSLLTQTMFSNYKSKSKKETIKAKTLIKKQYKTCFTKTETQFSRLDEDQHYIKKKDIMINEILLNI